MWCNDATFRCLFLRADVGWITVVFGGRACTLRCLAAGYSFLLRTEKVAVFPLLWTVERWLSAAVRALNVRSAYLGVCTLGSTGSNGVLLTSMCIPRCHDR